MDCLLPEICLRHFFGNACCVFFWPRCAGSVSYTHLDVYKRQAVPYPTNLNGSEFQNMFQKECESLWAGAVSPEEFAQRVDEQAAPILSK